MNNLFIHIEYLLLSHDCVIVPGLGAFIAIMHPAKFDFEKRLITPPGRSVMFNHAVSSDDGLLANSYVRKHDITFEEARQIILKETSLLKEQLNKDKEITTGNLGTLRIGEEGNMIFTPAADVATLNSALGFEALQLATTPHRQEATKSDSAVTTAVHKTHDSRFRFNKTFSKIAAAFIVLLTLTLTMILNPIPADDREQRASVVPVGAIIPSPTDGSDIKTGVPPEEAESLRVVETTEAEVSLPDHYLIVATFKSNSEAMNYIAANSKDADMQIVESRKVTRVAVAASDDLAELRKLLNSKEIHGKYPNAWIWTRN